MFVNGQPVPITEGLNTISIRERMDFGTKNLVMDALAGVAQSEGGKAAMSLHFGAYQIALMKYNVVGWSGPAFTGVACTPENISRLDPNEPLVQQVLAEIVARNPLQMETAPEKKDATNAGEPA